MSDYPSLIAALDRLGLPDEMRALIIAHHSEPHRHYHTLRHIDIMLGALPVDHGAAREMMAATLFHDIIYDPKRSDNEERSMEAFEAAVGRFPKSASLDRRLVSSMILATKGHLFRNGGIPEDEAINILLKADLSILWHPDREVYAWYAAGVRKEYGFVPEEQFREARAKILTGLRDDLLQSQQLTSAEARSLVRNVEWEIRSQAFS